MIEEARKWAEERAYNEGMAFEKAMSRVAPSEDEIQQAFNEGYIAGRACIDSRYEFIARHYGYETQREQFVEECSEAILAVQKLKRHGSKENFEALEEEVADVLIMATQMRLLMSTSTIDRIIQQKLQLQIQRIKEAEL
jgi:NTP pyrophosphatase (non-canonical NTP hydrolase)